MKEVIGKVWGIGEGLVTDRRGVFEFLMLQNQLPRWPKLGCCGWSSGRAGVGWEQRCWGSSRAPEGNAVGSSTSPRAPCAEPAASDLPGDVCVQLPKNPGIRCISRHQLRKPASCSRRDFDPKKDPAAAGKAASWQLGPATGAGAARTRSGCSS